MMGDQRASWEERYEQGAKRQEVFETLSFEPVPALGMPDGEVPERVGFPGQYPYTRGVHATGYRGRLWTMRQFAGFASVTDTNERFRHLLDAGQGGLSVAFDMPTLMGLDGDDSMALGEVGHCGVAVSSAGDMSTLFDRDSPGRSLGVDDDQRPGRGAVRLPARRCRGTGCRVARHSGALCRTTFSRSTSPRKSGSSLPSHTCGSLST